jgi:hypothetical protein
MKQIYIFLSYVFDDYLKTCKFLEILIPTYNICLYPILCYDKTTKLYTNSISKYF